MPATRPVFLRPFAAFLAASLFLTQSLFIHAVERNFWVERADSARRARESSVTKALSGKEARALTAGLSVPAPAAWTSEEVTRAYAFPAALPADGKGLRAVSEAVSLISGTGSLRSVRGPVHPVEDAPVVVFLQDAHGVSSAQENIARAILRLADARPDLLVGLEGASGPLDAASFRGPSAKVNRQLGELLFRADLIAGPEMAAFAAPAGVRFAGVEAADLYLRNVQVVRDAFSRRGDRAAALRGWAERVERLKSVLWPTELRELDRRRAENEAGLLSLPDYADFLAGRSDAVQLSSDFPQVALFRRVRAMEAALDFPAVTREMAALASRLSGRLSASELRELLRAGVSLRAGGLGLASYYRSFEKAARRSGFSPSDFPRFHDYVEYVAAADGVRPGTFAAEVRALERCSAGALCAGVSQAELLAVAGDLALVLKLAEFRMTPDEWKEYLSRRDSVLLLPARVARLEGVPAAGAAPSSLPLEGLEDFYRVAESRNAAMAENLFKALGRPSAGPPLAVLVCGGFHTDGVADLLVSRGAWVAVAAPNIDEAELSGARDPLAAFTRAPDPIEKIFEAPEPSLVMEEPLVQRPLTEPAKRMRRVIDGIAPAVALLLSRLRINRGEPGTSVAAGGLDGLRVDPGGDFAAADVSSAGASRPLTVVVGGPEVSLERLSPVEADFRRGSTVLSVRGKGEGLSLAVIERSPDLRSTIAELLTGLRFLLRRSAPWAASLLVVLMVYSADASAAEAAVRSEPPLHWPAVLDFWRGVRQWWRDVPALRLSFMLAAPALQSVVVLGNRLWSLFLQAFKVREWRRSPDGILSSEDGPSPEEAAWREALGRASVGGLTPDLLSRMMDSAWLLRGRHKIPSSGLNPGNPKQLKKARAELERLSRVALRSATLCADAQEALSERSGSALSPEGRALFKEILAGWFQFDALAESFIRSESVYRRTIDAALFRNSYGGAPDSVIERAWRFIRWLVGMQWEINRNLEALPEDERGAREAANVVDVLYPRTEDGSSPTVRALLKPEPRSKGLFQTQEEGNDRRKLFARLTVFFVAVPVLSTLPFLLPLSRADAGLAVVSFFLNFITASLYQWGSIWVVNAMNKAHRELLRRELDAARARVREYAASSGLPLPSAEKDIRRTLLSVEWAETARAFTRELLPSSAPSVDVVVLVPRDPEQERYFRHIGDSRSSLFRKDVPVVVLPASSGIESGAAAVNGMLEVERRWPRLEARFPRLQGRSPRRVQTAVLFTGGEGTEAFTAPPQAQSPVFEDFQGPFPTIFGLQVANAYRIAQSGRGGGVILGYADRMALGRLTGEEPGWTLLTSWADRDEVERQDLTVLTSAVDGRVDRIFAEFDPRDPAFSSFDLQNRLSRQYEVFAGFAVLPSGNGGEEVYRRTLSLYEDLRDYLHRWDDAGSRSFHLTSHFIVPLAILSRMAKEGELRARTKIDRYFAIHETRAKYEGRGDLAGFYRGLTDIYMRHRGAAVPFHTPRASGLATYFSRPEPPLRGEPTAAVGAVKAGIDWGASPAVPAAAAAIRIGADGRRPWLRDARMRKVFMGAAALGIFAAIFFTTFFSRYLSPPGIAASMPPAAIVVPGASHDGGAPAALPSAPPAPAPLPVVLTAPPVPRALKRIKSAAGTSKPVPVLIHEGSEKSDVGGSDIPPPEEDEDIDPPSGAASSRPDPPSLRGGPPEEHRDGAAAQGVLFPMGGWAGAWWGVVRESRRKRRIAVLARQARRALAVPPRDGWEKGSMGAVKRWLRLASRDKPAVDVRGFENDLRVLRFLRRARPGGRPGGLDERLLRYAALETPAAVYMPSAAAPACVPAVDVSAAEGAPAVFIASRMRELREAPLAVLPLVTSGEVMPAGELERIKEGVKASLLAGPGGWTEEEVDELFERLRFGDERLVITARTMREDGQTDPEPAVMMDARILHDALSRRAAPFLGIPPADLAVSLFTRRRSGFTAVDGLAGFRLLIIESADAVRDQTEALGRALRAFEKSGRSA